MYAERDSLATALLQHDGGVTNRNLAILQQEVIGFRGI
jgi:hypothetical protein